MFSGIGPPPLPEAPVMRDGEDWNGPWVVTYTGLWRLLLTSRWASETVAKAEVERLYRDGYHDAGCHKAYSITETAA